MIGESEKDFQLLLYGHIAFQILWSGTKLGVFEIVHKNENLTCEEISDGLNLSLKPCETLLSNLCSLKLLAKRENRYSTTGLSEKYLVADSPDNLLNIIEFNGRIVYPGIMNSPRSLETGCNLGLEYFRGNGDTLYQRLSNHPELEKVFQEAMASMPSNEALFDILDLSKVRHLCDAGGGNGNNAIGLSHRHSDLMVTIFDLPSICEKAMKNIALSGMNERVSVHPGNIFSDSFPKGIDAILYCHLASIWSKETNCEFFKRAYQALPEKGKLFVYNMVPNKNNTGPFRVTSGSLYFQVLATGQGFMYTIDKYTKMLEDAGFQDIEMRKGPFDHVLIISTKPSLV